MSCIRSVLSCKTPRDKADRPHAGHAVGPATMTIKVILPVFAAIDPWINEEKYFAKCQYT